VKFIAGGGDARRQRERFIVEARAVMYGSAPTSHS
jgi:hypothetical protein